jgi:hypothetical protein
MKSIVTGVLLIIAGGLLLGADFLPMWYRVLRGFGFILFGSLFIRLGLLRR